MPAVRVGLLGGTFDPPHLGHLLAATEVREALGLDAVRLVVVNDPWQKSAERRVTPAGTRLRLCAAATAADPLLVVDDVEVRLGGVTWTARTLDHLHREHPEVEFVVVLGADAASRVPTWRDGGACLRRVPVAVVDRPGAGETDLPGLLGHATRVPVTQVDVSSTEVRRRAAEGRSIAYLVPDAVRSIVERERLYRRRS